MSQVNSPRMTAEFNYFREKSLVRNLWKSLWEIRNHVHLRQISFRKRDISHAKYPSDLPLKKGRSLGIYDKICWRCEEALRRPVWMSDKIALIHNEMKTTRYLMTVHCLRGIMGKTARVSLLSRSHQRHRETNTHPDTRLTNTPSYPQYHTLTEEGQRQIPSSHKQRDTQIIRHPHSDIHTQSHRCRHSQTHHMEKTI